MLSKMDSRLIHHALSETISYLLEEDNKELLKLYFKLKKKIPN